MFIPLTLPSGVGPKWWVPLAQVRHSQNMMVWQTFSKALGGAISNPNVWNKHDSTAAMGEPAAAHAPENITMATPEKLQVCCIFTNTLHDSR